MLLRRKPAVFSWDRQTLKITGIFEGDLKKGGGGGEIFCSSCLVSASDKSDVCLCRSDQIRSDQIRSEAERSGSMAAADEEYRCFVGGLAWTTDDGRLEDAFKPYGQVLESKVVNDRETGRSRGFGFVTFSNEKSMRDAIQSLNGSDLDGRNITVNQAESRSNSGGGYRRGGSYGSSGGSRYGGSGGGYGNGRSGGDDRGNDRGYGASRNSGYGSRGRNFGESQGENTGSNAKSWRSNRNDEY